MALNIPIGPQTFRSELAREIFSLAAANAVGVTAEDARSNPTDYLRYVLIDENGRPLNVDHSTRLYAETFEHCYRAGRHVSFVTPPGFGKTTLALALLTRAIGNNPKLRTVVVTADEKDSINAVTLARSIVLTQQFQTVFPKAKPDVEKSSDARGWRQTAWYMRAGGMRKDPTMQAVAMEPKKESIRVDLGLFDDMVTEATSEGEIHERIVKRFHTTWIEGRCSPHGWAVYQQNVRRKNDLAHRLREDPKFCSVWIGVTPDCERLFVEIWNPPAGLPILQFPERYDATREQPREEMPIAHYRYTMPLPARKGWDKERLLAVNPSARSQLYELRALTSQDLILPNWSKRKQFAGTAAQLAGLQVDEEGVPIMTALDRMRFQVLAGVDISSPRRPGTCLWVLLKDEHGNYYPLFMHRGRWTQKELEFWLDRLWNNGVEFGRLQFESNGVQELVRANLVERGTDAGKPWVRAIKGQDTNWSTKWGLSLGFPALDKDFEDGFIHWPTQEKYTSTPWAANWNAFEAMAETTTREETDKTPPDDLMAFLFARQAGRGVIAGQPRRSPLQRLSVTKPDEVINANAGQFQGAPGYNNPQRKKGKRFEY